MKMIYLSNARIPSGDAAPIQQIQVADAFANAGLDITFLKPFYFELAKYSNSHIRDLYSVSNNFKIKTIPSFLSLSKPAYGFVDDGYGGNFVNKIRIPGIGGASLIISMWFYIHTKRLLGMYKEPTIIYSRNLNATAVFLHQREKWFKNSPVKIFIEAHALVQKPENLYNYIINSCDGIISITHSLKKDIISKYNVNPAKILVAPDGVNMKWLKKDNLSKKDIRKKMGVPEKFKKLVVYSGSFLAGKGVDVLVRAAEDFDDKVLFYLVGGTPEAIDEIRQTTNVNKLSNVRFAGFIPHRDVAMYQRAADVLVLPNTDDYNLKSYTSPLKLFEYMATGQPIVASDLPVFREVLCHESNSILVEPSKTKALGDGIKRLLGDEKLSNKISSKALEEVKAFDWDVRAKNIIDFFYDRTGWKFQDLSS